MATVRKSAKAASVAQAFSWKKQFDARPDVINCWVDKAKCMVYANLRVVKHDDTWTSSASQRSAWYAKQAKTKASSHPFPTTWVVDESSEGDELRLQRLNAASFRDDQQAILASEVTVDQYGTQGTGRLCHLILPDEAKQLRSSGIFWYYYRNDAQRAARSWIKSDKRKPGEFCIVWKHEEIYYFARNQYAADAVGDKLCWVFRRHKQTSVADIGWSCEDNITRDHAHYAVELIDPVTNEVRTVTYPAYEPDRAVSRAMSDHPNFEFIEVKEVDAAWAEAVEYDAIESLIVDDYERDLDPLLNDNGITSVATVHKSHIDKESGEAVCLSQTEVDDLLSWSRENEDLSPNRRDLSNMVDSQIA